MNSRLTIIPALLILCSVLSCDSSFSPKPRGYFRIDLPEKSYQVFDSTYPYSFEYPKYGVLLAKTGPNAEPYWMDLYFPAFRATIHLSYKDVKSNLNDLLEDSRTMVNKHMQKSTGIDEYYLEYPEHRVFGVAYHIRGSEAASPLQFIMTDSTRHFLRGSLYFSAVPNNDSLEPVILFLQQDADHLVRTLKWK